MYILKYYRYTTPVCSVAVRLLGFVCAEQKQLLCGFFEFLLLFLPLPSLFFGCSLRARQAAVPSSLLLWCWVWSTGKEGLPLLCCCDSAPADMTAKLSGGIHSHSGLVPTGGKIQQGCKAALGQQNVWGVLCALQRLESPHQTRNSKCQVDLWSWRDF